jgi:sulfatase maturation enzyme AslB (radical SAM superfamily)
LNDSVKPRHKCRGCDYEKNCGGGCPATNFIGTGSVYVPGDTECQLGLVCRRVNVYMRRRHDEVFGTDWAGRVEITSREKCLFIV